MYVIIFIYLTHEVNIKSIKFKMHLSEGRCLWVLRYFVYIRRFNKYNIVNQFLVNSLFMKRNSPKVLESTLTANSALKCILLFAKLIFTKIQFIF